MRISALALTALALLAIGRPARADEHAPGGRSAAKTHRVVVSQPRPIRDERHIVRDDRRIGYPDRDAHGARITMAAARMPPEHGIILGDAGLIGSIAALAAVETLSGHYYWHADHGVRYAHYRDDHGLQWYGFYRGDSFYWTRYFEGRWWWHDERFNRWVYFSDGRWWWQSPEGVSQVYVENNYYPVEKGGVVTVEDTGSAADSDPRQALGAQSPDGTRTVKLYGIARDAFLYDNSSGQPVFLKHLGQGIDRIRFTGGTPGQALQIRVDFKDGRSALLDAGGNALPAPGADGH